MSLHSLPPWWRTMTELPSFKSLVSRCRCIIPADGFYERRKEGKRKVPMWVYPKTKEPFGLAGLWEVWRKPDGKRLGSFTIITTEPSELVRSVHNRVPVLTSDQWDEYWRNMTDFRNDYAAHRNALADELIRLKVDLIFVSDPIAAPRCNKRYQNDPHRMGRDKN
jgi:putative SOS response-associated peptidase YedK